MLLEGIFCSDGNVSDGGTDARRDMLKVDGRGEIVVVTEVVGLTMGQQNTVAISILFC